MLRVALVFLIAYLIPVILATSYEGGIVIDGYTVNKSFEFHEADLPLGTTLVLVCRYNGCSRTPNVTWMCLNDSCIEKRYAGRNIIDVHDRNESFLTINITSECDSGNYTCTVSDEECDYRQDFHLKVTGGAVVHSYGRLILNEGVIFKRRQLLPPNKSKGAGKIECREWNGSREARFTYYGLNDTRAKVEPTVDESGFNTTVVIKRKNLNPKKFAIEGKCAGVFHYLFLNEDADCLNLDRYVNSTSSGSSITVTIGELPCSIPRAIVGYSRLVEKEVWVEGEHVNLRACATRTFSSLVSGTKYRITAWGLSGGDTNNRRRCQSPTVHYINTTNQRASPPRGVDMKRDGDKTKMHWMRPMYSNGDISHYRFKRPLKNGTIIEIDTPYNYYTLTGMKKGHSYNFSLMAVHEDGLEGESVMIQYNHSP